MNLATLLLTYILGTFIICALTSSQSSTPTALHTVPPTITPPSSQPPDLYARNRDWRDSSLIWSTANCSTITISSGFIILDHNQRIYLNVTDFDADKLSNGSKVHFAQNITFTPNCPDTQIENSKSNEHKNVMEFVEGNNNMSSYIPPFSTSVIPTCICVSIALAICVCAMLVMLLQYDTRPKYQIFTVVLSTATITVVFVKVTKFLTHQANSGYFDGQKLSEYIESNQWINVMLPINSFFLIMAQVQVLFRVFERKREKTVVFWFGLVLALSLAILWAISIVYDADLDISAAQDAVTVLAYLFKIATSILFSSCLTYYSIINYKIAFLPEVFVLALLAHTSAISPIILFIQDILTIYIDQWAEFADIVTLMISTIVAWEWIYRTREIERRNQLESVLGKQYFEEDITPTPTNNNGNLSHDSTMIPTTNHMDRSRINSESTTLVQTPPATSPSPVYLGFKFVKEWLKYPIGRPDTSVSNQTIYEYSQAPIPPASGITSEPQEGVALKTSLDGGEDSNNYTKLPKFYHEFTKRPN